MIPRDPDERAGGNFYRLLPEGRIKNYDGVTIKSAPSVQGLDLNRQFPVFWEPNQPGAGHFPGSEPEPAAAMRFIAAHPNITGAVSFHTAAAGIRAQIEAQRRDICQRSWIKDLLQAQQAQASAA
jgi:hypothetical protein